MKKKIIITGGLGYIGTELCKIYSGFSWHHKIIVIDNKFVSERVNQLRNWSIEFIHGDILDKELIKKYFSDADIVHHLAGITDVPRTKSESSSKKDEEDRSFNASIWPSSNCIVFAIISSGKEKSNLHDNVFAGTALKLFPVQDDN